MKKRLEAIIIAIVIVILPLAGLTSKIAVVQAKDSRPRILLDSYKIIEGRLTPGGTVKIKFTFKNTSKTITANNLLITYSGSDNRIYPNEGEANQFYIDEISANSTESVEILMRVTENTAVYQEKSYSTQSIEQSIMSKVEFNINYLYDQGGVSYEASNTAFIMLPITQECVLGVKSIAVAETVVLKSKSLVSAVCVNEGTTQVSNVVMHIDGNVLEEQKSVEIGNISVNSQQAFDCYVNMQEQGKQQLEIYFTYEDEDGVNFQTAKKEYTLYVTENETIMSTHVGSGNMEQQTNKNASGGFISTLSNVCILGAAFIALILVIIFIVRKKHK